MDFSELKKRIYNYLGFHGVAESPETDALIDSCLSELLGIVQFRYTYRIFDELPEFLKKEPYAGFLSGCNRVILSAMTLGAGVDIRINRLSRTDMARSAVLDSCASAGLEYLSDEYERGLGEKLTYRFCPGYGGSPLEDVREIFELIRPEKIGITLNENCFMLPAKSMAGVIGVGKETKKSCGQCIMLGSCRFREEGTRCYGSERE